MRIDRGLVGLGLFLITAGGVMLAVRQGLIEESVAERAWTLWPAVLIGLGLSIVLAGRPGASIGALVVALTLGAMLGGVAATGWSGGFGACGGDRSGTAFGEQSGSITPGAGVSIAISCGHLAVGTVAGTTWSLAGTSPDGALPNVSTSAGGLRVDNPDRGPISVGGAANTWTLALPRDPGFDIDVATNGGSSDIILDGAVIRDATFETNGGSLSLDLRGVTEIGDVEIHTNLGSTTVRLPAHNVSAAISVNAGSASLCVPAGAGLRIELDSVAASNDFADHGLVQAEDVWQTPGYASAANRVELALDVNAGSVSLDPAPECVG